MRGRKRIENSELIDFLNPDLKGEIIPKFGLGGFNFKQSIKDFEQIWTYSLFEGKIKNNLKFELDTKNYYLIISTENKEIEIDIDLFTGKISSISCGIGYEGKLNNGIGIGTSIKDALKKDSSLGFNPDTDWIERMPFDGLIIHVPNKHKDKFMENVVWGTETPDFKIETIELIDINFAKKFYDGQIIFN